MEPDANAEPLGAALNLSNTDIYWSTRKWNFIRKMIPLQLPDIDFALLFLMGDFSSLIFWKTPTQNCVLFFVKYTIT